jgi:hypothetical protein
MPGITYPVVHHLAAHVQAGTSMDEADWALLNRLRPPKYGWPYIPGNADPLFYGGDFSFPEASARTRELQFLLVRCALRNPFVDAKHLLCFSSPYWSLFPKDDDSVVGIPLGVDEGGGLWTHDGRYRLEDWNVPPTPPNGTPLSTRGQRALARGLLASMQRPRWEWLWRPAPYVYLLLGASAVAAVRGRRLTWLLILVPVTANGVGVILFSTVQLFRYDYPVLIVGMLLTGFLASAAGRQTMPGVVVRATGKPPDQPAGLAPAGSEPAAA